MDLIRCPNSRLREPNIQSNSSILSNIQKVRLTECYCMLSKGIFPSLYRHKSVTVKNIELVFENILILQNRKKIISDLCFDYKDFGKRKKYNIDFHFRFRFVCSYFNSMIRFQENKEGNCTLSPHSIQNLFSGKERKSSNICC